MSAHAQAMKEATEEVKGAAVSLRADLEGDSKAVLSAAARLAREAKAFSDEVQDSLARLSGAFERTTSQADYLRATIEQDVTAVRGLSEEIGTKAAEVTGRLEASSEAAREAFGQADAAAKSMSGTFRTQGEELSGIAERAAQRLREQMEQAAAELTALANANSESFTELAAYAGRKLQQAGELVRPHVESLNAASDRAVERAERAGQAFQGRAGDLRAAAEEAGTRIGQVGEGLRGLSSELREVTSLAEHRELQAAAELRAQNEALAASSAGAQKAAGALRAAVEEELTRLQALSGELERLTAGLRGELATQTGALGEATQAAKGATVDLREETQAQLADLRETADTSLETLTRLGDVVAERTKALEGSAERAFDRAGELGKLMDAQRDRFDGTIRTMATRFEEIGMQFQERAEELRQAADEAGQQALTLKQSDLETRRDLFLRSATVMIEDLNAQAMDLTRLFDGEVPDDLWRRYRKGDRSIFARRLGRSKPEDRLAPQIVERYKEDERFREQATRYVNQFESLMNQAAACDPEHILSATFLTADVGKLYLLLSRALGRGE
jgi:DNA-binding ferritin-like protein